MCHKKIVMLKCIIIYCCYFGGSSAVVGLLGPAGSMWTSVIKLLHFSSFAPCVITRYPPGIGKDRRSPSSKEPRWRAWPPRCHGRLQREAVLWRGWVILRVSVRTGWGASGAVPCRSGRLAEGRVVGGGSRTGASWSGRGVRLYATLCRWGNSSWELAPAFAPKVFCDWEGYGTFLSLVT